MASSFDELANEARERHPLQGPGAEVVGGALLGAALASVPGAALAEDDCRRLGRRCRRDSQCLLEELRKAQGGEGMRLPRRQEPLRREVRRP
jgi:hypothetical protein